MLYRLSETLLANLLSKPQVAITTGHLIFRGALMCCTAGCLLQVPVKAISIVHALGSQTHTTDVSLSDVLPGIPTWWIPESAISFALLIMAGAFGVWLAHSGKRLRRLYA
ncbi:hypothetical protein AVXHC19_10720 [Acidovorax sacchari]